MSLTRKIAHNTAIQFAGKMFGTVIAVVTVGIMLRYLGPEGFGQYSTAINFLSVFAILIDLGLYLIVTREISKDGADEKSLISNVISFRLVLGIAMMCVAPLVGLYMPYAHITQMAILINASAFLFMSLNQILVGVFQKYLRMDKVALAEVVGRVFWLIAVVLVVRLDVGLLWIVGTNSLSAIFNFILLLWFSKKYVDVTLAFDFSLWRKIWTSAAPLALNVVLNVIYFKAGVVILTIVGTEEAVGIFGAAQKILENLITFSAIFAGLLFPIFARHVHADKAQFKKVYRRGIDAISVLVFPLVGGVMVLSKQIVVFFGGADFAGSAPVLQILMIAVGAIFFGNVFGNIVVAADLQKKILPMYVINAILAVMLSIVLIPRISVYGAALSTLVTEMIVAVSAGMLVKKYLDVTPSFVVPGKSLLSALCMVVVLYLLPKEINVIILIAIGAAVYGGVLFLVGGISKKEIVEIVSMRKESGVGSVNNGC